MESIKIYPIVWIAWAVARVKLAGEIISNRIERSENKTRREKKYTEINRRFTARDIVKRECPYSHLVRAIVEHGRKYGYFFFFHSFFFDKKKQEKNPLSWIHLVVKLERVKLWKQRFFFRAYLSLIF